MHKIAITGPESSGKTTLATQLSKEFDYPLVPEFAREYLAEMTTTYQLDDVLHMANEQLNQELALQDQSTVHDTDLTVYAIWLKEKFNHDCDWINEHIAMDNTKVYLLCGVLDNWEEDPLREHPNLADRQRLFNDYVNLLNKYDKNFYIISGTSNDRLKKAKEIMDNLI